MIGIVVPVHNEEELLPACLAALGRAIADPALSGESVHATIVLDACSDASERIARHSGAQILCSSARNVGAARATGAAAALALGARWLAFTDADSEVPPDWLSRQLVLGADAVCGIVAVKDWSSHPATVRRRFLRSYQARDGHRHIHGANLGLSAAAYEKAGGFSPLPAHEDVALVRRLEATGAAIAWVANPCVFTNGRPFGKLAGGFATYLRDLRLPARQPGDSLAVAVACLR